MTLFAFSATSSIALLVAALALVELAFALQVLVSRDVTDGLFQPALHLFTLVSAQRVHLFRQDALLLN